MSLKHKHEHEEHNHTHDIKGLSGKKIFWVTVLNAAITIAEIIGGLMSGSLALLSDAFHNLSDTLAIAMAYIANKISQKPKDARRTYGYKRAEIISAFINSGVLLIISILLIAEAVRRFQEPQSIDGTLMITVTVIGLLANILSVFLLQKDSERSLNIKSSYLHLISDTVSSIGVLIGGIAIMAWDTTWIDPVITVLISVYIIFEAWRIVKKTINILMQSSADLDYESIKRDVENVEGVKNIHHVHSWMSNENTIYFEAHIDMEDMLLSEAEKVYDEINELLKKRYGVNHTTLQAEVDKCCNKDVF